MDRALARSELRRLMELLELPTTTYGNIPLMKAQYRKRLLELHPDKGGDTEKMAELNVLWEKFMQNVATRRNAFVARVGGLDQCQSAAEYLGKKFESKICRIPDFCKKGLPFCKCICCKLLRQHIDLKMCFNRKCLVWGECFCFRCFCMWFALHPESELAFQRWKSVIAGLEFVLLDITFCK
ncbi:Small T antigen [Bofec polyomavirus LSF72]|nr:Small T antigen [Bofec polyomavirus LSF72]